MLENELILLRAIEPEDIELISVWENDRNLWEVSTTIAPFSKYILKKYIENADLDIYEAKQLRLMIVSKTNIKTVGAIDLFDFEPYHGRAGVGILVYDRNDRNKGYATEAIKLIIDYAFHTIGLKQLYCNVTPDNSVSIKLFQSLGFEITGLKKAWLKTFNTWKDEYMLQLINK